MTTGRAVEVALRHLDTSKTDRRTALVRASLVALGAGLGIEAARGGGRAEAATPARRFDVSTYGAVGDGTDERAALQRAIDDGAEAAVAAGDPGGPYVVYLPPVSVGYGIGPADPATGLGGLRIRTGCTLTGPDGGLSRIVARGDLNSSVVEGFDQVNGTDDVTLANLEIDGNGLNRPLTQASAALVLMTLRGAGNAGTGLQNEIGSIGGGERNRRFKVVGCYLHDSPNVALALQYMSDSFVFGNEIGNNNRDSVTHFYDNDSVRILNNYIHDGGDDMIGFNAENDVSSGHVIDGVVVANNVIVGERFAGGGVSLRGVNRAVVRNNVMVATFGAGVTVFNYNATGSNEITVCDNAILDVGQNNQTGAGIGIDIQAYGPSQQSLSGFGPVGHVLVDGNLVVNAAQHGILVSAGIPNQRATDITISTNRVHCGPFASGWGIALHGAGEIVDPLVLANSVVGAGQYGVSISDGTGLVTRPTIFANVVRNSGSAGIRVALVDSPMIVGNRCFDTRTPATQSYGAAFQLPVVGRMTEHGNDFSGVTAAVGFALGPPSNAGHMSIGLGSVLGGAGSPENNVVARPGSLYARSDGGSGSTLYVKEAGAGTTGWTAK